MNVALPFPREETRVKCQALGTKRPIGSQIWTSWHFIQLKQMLNKCWHS